MTTAALTLTNGTVLTVVRGPTGAWDGEARCPVRGCSEPAIHVRCYDEEITRTVSEGRIHERAPAWCRGRHDAPIGELAIEVVENPGVLVPMGVGEPEVVRVRIY